MTSASHLDQKYINLAVDIYQYEKTHPIPDFCFGWEWDDIGINPASLNKLMLLSIVDRKYESNSSKQYLLSDLGKVIAEDELKMKEASEAKASEAKAAKAAENGGNTEGESGSSEVILPESNLLIDLDHLFEDIIGYPNIKELFRESLQLPKPIHILLAGPPSTAKTMFLSDIEAAVGEQGLWLLGSGTSKAGLWEAIIEDKPKYIMIDELEKMAAVDYASLLSLMEKGRLTRTKVGKKADLHLTAWVFASANRIDKVPSELLSRFRIFHLKEYNVFEYIEVVKATLVRREGIAEQEAKEIAMALSTKSHDVRDAVRVARVSKRVGVKRAIKLIVD